MKAEADRRGYRLKFSLEMDDEPFSKDTPAHAKYELDFDKGA